MALVAKIWIMRKLFITEIEKLTEKWHVIFSSPVNTLKHNTDGVVLKLSQQGLFNIWLCNFEVLVSILLCKVLMHWTYFMHP